MNLIEKAREFAHAAHDSVQQVRKYTGEPYWVHTDEVAEIVASVGIEEAICAAHLHDVLEDVFPINPYYNHQEIKNRFGLLVYGWVSQLTDEYTKERYPKKNRAERKALEARRIESISHVAKSIKLADLISNTQSIVEHDPGFAVTYLKEKFELLGPLSDGHPVLLDRATRMCVENMKKLDIPILTVVKT